MKIEYDQQADAMYIRLRAGSVAESDQVCPGVVLDFDANENRKIKRRSWHLMYLTLRDDFKYRLNLITVRSNFSLAVIYLRL